jgi:hypothetical protein
MAEVVLLESSYTPWRARRRPSREPQEDDAGHPGQSRILSGWRQVPIALPIAMAHIGNVCPLWTITLSLESLIDEPVDS